MTPQARARNIGIGIGLGALVGVMCGCASALFLFLLKTVTNYRTKHEIIVYSLPFAGLLIGWLYERYGQAIKGGSNLVVDTIVEKGPEIPLRMAPMVLVGTVLTHLFGGSAGREGTAVQMAVSMSDWAAHRLKLSKDLREQILVAGIAGGFGSVFGTPIAGTVFGLEMIVLGRLKYEGLLPAMVAALIGDLVTRAWGIGHAAYLSSAKVPLTMPLFGKWVVFALAVAISTTAFIELTHWLKAQSVKYLKRLPWRMAAGGLGVVVLWKVFGTGIYLGLGVPTIQRAFHDPNLPLYAFAVKLVFTAVTLSAGYLGGEVTPLFFVGAALGSTMARLLGIPLELGAGVGLAAVFAASSNTPLALSIMALELLGANVFPHVVIVCVLSYLFVGHRSIYTAQRLVRGKGGTLLPEPTRLHDLGKLQIPASPGEGKAEDKSG